MYNYDKYYAKWQNIPVDLYKNAWRFLEGPENRVL